MDNRTINEYYTEIGMDLIQTEDTLIDIANSQATIKKSKCCSIIFLEQDRWKQRYY